MQFQNPVVRGFYPDPSVCYGNGHFYLVTSSFQYFPGVPLFESDDLVNWKQIGHVLTRESQVMLDGVRSSGGVFAPTIRFHEGRFYMVTNNNSTNENFYVYTDDIYGEWSDPVVVERDGIDPSLLFDEGHVYFLSNGTDDEGKYGIVQCEIEIETGRKISPSRRIWTGSGGRFIESPHMYHIGKYYYLMVAEGGTEYGHMVTYTRAESPWGPFEDYAKNPVLTNRDKAPFVFQGIGHGDLVQKEDGSYFMLCLGFRQIDTWEKHHTLGRETFLAPVNFSDDGWFTCGNGTMELGYEIPGNFSQERKEVYTFENTSWDKEWIYLRKPNLGKYHLEENCATLEGSELTLEDVDSPTFLGIRQIDFDMTLTVDVTLDAAQGKDGCAGVTVYMSEREHYDILLRPRVVTEGLEAVLRERIGTLMQEQVIVLPKGKVTLKIAASATKYMFSVLADGEEIALGDGDAKYLSSETAGGFTGVVLGLFAEGEVSAKFEEFRCAYNE